MTSTPPKVFISYSHDSSEHAERVLALSDRLRADGIDCTIDQYEPAPPEGWPQWMDRQVEEADFVLVVCTGTYLRRASAKKRPGEGRGVRFESVLIVQALYDAAMRNEKFIPVLFAGADADQIPNPLRAYTRYRADAEDGYDALYRHLTGQPRVTKPDLGRTRKLRAVEPRPTLEPTFPDDDVRALSQVLEDAYRRHEELVTTGGDPTAVKAEILDLRRKIRDGGRLKPGDFLLEGRFKLLHQIGRGGFATVWKAYDRTQRGLVAIKVLHSQYAEDRTRRERFFRGARKMAELQHQGIVRVVVEEGEEEGVHFFVMEHMAGGDLRQAVLAGRLSAADRLRIIVEVGEALDFAHQRGVVHRDVKPANVLLDDRDRPKLTDFDLVRAQDTTGGTRTGMLGTFLYAAPEAMHRAQEAGIPADVYGLGMTAIFALHGADLPPDVLRDAPGFVERLEMGKAEKVALARAVSWEQEDRWGSVAELCRELGPPPARKGRRPRAAPGPPKPGDERVNEKDGTILIYVPGGDYTLGAKDITDHEKPVHRVRLSPFWIGKYPVTNEQYAKFLRANPHQRKPPWWDDEKFNQIRKPVVGVNWYEAQAYCRWAGLDLPSEAQWEAAARGRDGRPYPWGKEVPTVTRSNFGDPEGHPTWVDQHPMGSGPFGALDQAGNVWEWCLDCWAEEAYRKRKRQVDPVIVTGDSGVRSLRGGSWEFPAEYLRAAYRGRSSAMDRARDIGFRCASSADR